MSKKKVNIIFNNFNLEELELLSDEIKKEIHKKRMENSLSYIDKLIPIIEEMIDNTDCDMWEFETEDEDVFYLTDVLRGLEYHKKVTLAEK